MNVKLSETESVLLPTTKATNNRIIQKRQSSKDEDPEQNNSNREPVNNKDIRQIEEKIRPLKMIEPERVKGSD